MKITLLYVNLEFSSFFLDFEKFVIRELYQISSAIRLSFDASKLGKYLTEKSSGFLDAKSS